MIRLHRSNRVEELAGMLARVLEPPLADPFARECVVVQRRGMERWLEMQLADAHGICAAMEFLFPRRFLRERLFGPLLGVETSGPEAFEPARLTWEIAALLPELVGAPGFQEVARYLESDASPRRLVALSRRIAEVFDDYAIYRPDRVQAWEQGVDPDDWQASLWRALVERCGADHSARLVARACAQLARPDLEVGALLERVCVFGLSSLPPLFLRALCALGRRREVHLFVLAPSREWIGELRSPVAAARAGTRAEALYLETGNPLLASLGRSSREFFAGLEEEGYAEGGEGWCDPLAAGDGLLHRLQSDLLELRDPGGANGMPPHELTALGESLRVHSCAGAMREAEVVRDQILAAFEDMRDLRPQDVVILTPDAATYGPLLEAVFEAGKEREPLDVCVADRGSRDSDARAQVLEALVELVRGRVTSAELMDLLARDGVRARFGIASADLETLRGWVERAGIRWGVDADHRAAEGQPRLAQNTWRRGLERLLLGWAAGEVGRVGEVIAAPAGQGASAELLGRFVEFCETVFELRERLCESRSPVAWSAELGRALERVCAPLGETGAEEQRRVAGALERVAEAAGAAGFDAPLPLDAFWSELKCALGDSAHAPTHSFLSGAMTVCELVPMRSIPFRVVAMLGLGDSAFPRADTRPDFDWLARERLRGDRSRRDDDRQLFLEALLSARDRLILTYPGRSPRDGTARPPSVVVDELLDALQRGFRLAGKPLERKSIVVEHPLHPFSPRYFSGEDTRLFSYDARAHRAYTGRAQLTAAPRPFVEGVLPASPGPAARELSLEELEDFLGHPARWFCRRRLGLRLRDEDDPLDEDEPLELDALERWALGSEILLEHARGVPLRELLERAALRGDLPPGPLGARARADLEHSVARRLGDLARHSCAATPRSQEFELELAGVRLCGALPGLIGDGRLASLQFGRLGSHRELAVWVRHVVANQVLGPTESFLFGAPGDGKKAVLRFTPVCTSDAILRDWLAWLAQTDQRPLPIFRRASRAFARCLARERSLDEARHAARQAFASDGYSSALNDRSDPYVDLVVRGQAEPLGAEFEEFAEALFAPLFAHREELE